jgi:hypothetical protein
LALRKISHDTFVITHNKICHIPLSRQRERGGPAPLFKDYERQDAAQRQVRVDIIFPLTLHPLPLGRGDSVNYILDYISPIED